MFRSASLVKNISLGTLSTRKRQGGWLMPMAAFIVVVMGLLAASLSRLSTQSTFTPVQEQVSVQAFFAAESAAQYAMNKLFYSTSIVINRSDSTNNCTSINGSTISYTAAGMNGCVATVLCTASIDGADTITFYEIKSRANCGVLPVSSERTVSVKAYLE